MSDDLPTPPLPLAIAITRVFSSTESALAPRSDAAAKLGRQRLLLLLAEDVEGELDALDAVEGQKLAVDLLLEARAKRAAGDGQRDRDLRGPVVSTSARRTMPSSTTERPSSGSITRASARIELFARRPHHELT